MVLDGGLRAATARSIVLPGMFIRQLEIARQAGEGFLDHEECREGLVCVAAPIVGPSGRAVAAISVAGATQTLKVEQIADAVHHAAAQISRKAGPDVELIASGS